MFSYGSVGGRSCVGGAGAGGDGGGGGGHGCNGVGCSGAGGSLIVDEVIALLGASFSCIDVEFWIFFQVWLLAVISSPCISF